MTDAPRPDLTAEDWAAMRARFEDRLASAYDPETCSCAWCVSSRDALLALDALARQQEANARLTDENARLREDGRFLPPPNPDPIVEALSSALADRDATIARVEKALALAESVVNLGSAFRTALAEAAVVERDSTIARLRENAREMRDALSDYATPGEGWRETWHADVFERSRRLAPDATALTPAKEADRG